MLKNSENNWAEEFGLVTPTPDVFVIVIIPASFCIMVMLIFTARFAATSLH